MSTADSTDSPSQTQCFDWADAFHNHEPVSEGHVKEIREINSVFAKEFSESLAAILRARVTSGIQETRQTGSVDGKGVLRETALLLLLEIEPVGCTMAIALDTAFSYRVLGGLLGDKGSEIPKSERVLTDIELSILESLGPSLVRSLEKAWAPAGSWKFNIAAQRKRLGTKNLSSLGEGLVVMELVFQIEEKPGRMTLLYPLVIGKSSLSAPTTSHEDPDRRELTQAVMLEKLKAAPIDIEASIPECSIRLSDLLRLQAGDVVRLDASVNQPVDLLINGERRLQGRFAPIPQRRALQIEYIPVLPNPKEQREPDREDVTEVNEADEAE